MNNIQLWALAGGLLLLIGCFAVAIELWREAYPEAFRKWCFTVLVLTLCAFAWGFSFVTKAYPHDHNRPDLDGWYRSLNSGKGPCCDGPKVDAKYVADVDWESSGGRYRVRIDGVWIDVPDDAVLKGANRDGRALVWPSWQDGQRAVRCFIPGIMG